MEACGSVDRKKRKEIATRVVHQGRSSLCAEAIIFPRGNEGDWPRESTSLCHPNGRFD